MTADPVPQSESHLPIVDVSGWADPARRPAIVAAVTQALEQSGFLYVRGLPIESDQIREAFRTARRFFRAPEKFKQRAAYRDAEANFGWQGLEGESLDPGAMPDLKEAFTMRDALGSRAREQTWPDEHFRSVATGFYAQAFDAARLLLRVMAHTLALPEDFFTERHGGENVTLRFLYYPAGLAPRAPGQIGAGAHTDYGSLTLLFQGEVGGLEVRGLDGTWRPAPPVPGCVVINTGDLMERWTNGRFKSTPHRVAPIPGARDRMSIALFVDPDSAVDVECIPSCHDAGNPPRYPPITAGAHIQAKILATHGKKTS